MNKALPKLLRGAARKRGFAEADLLVKWPQVCPQIAHCTAPAKLSGKILTLQAESSSVGQQVRMYETQLIEQINTFFGQPLVQRIRPVATYMPLNVKTIHPPKLQASNTATEWATQKTRSVRDDSLRQRLTRLGSLIKTKTEQGQQSS